MEFRKVKNMAKSNKGNRTARNDYQKRVATLNMILHNPMFNPESRRKSAEARKGRRPIKPFPLNNQYWKLRRDLKDKSNTNKIIPDTETKDARNNISKCPLQDNKNAVNIKRKAVTCRPVRFSAYLNKQS